MKYSSENMKFNLMKICSPEDRLLEILLYLKRVLLQISVLLVLVVVPHQLCPILILPKKRMKADLGLCLPDGNVVCNQMVEFIMLIIKIELLNGKTLEHRYFQYVPIFHVFLLLSIIYLCIEFLGARSQYYR